MKIPILSRCAASFVLFAAAIPFAGAGPDSDWTPLFNGRDLAGWTPKFAKHPLGVNLHDTFRVEDGILKVAYDRYPSFDRQFGHLYSNVAYSHYVLRLEYRFVGKPMADAPPWAGYNSGVMVHAQSPLSLGLNQDWPVSLELQFLCVGTSAGRQTGNACTPGTHLELDGKLTTAHIIDAKDSALSPHDEWVEAEIEVHGHDLVIHRINGREVLRYGRPQLDPKDGDAQRLIAAGHPLTLGFGHIALQAESQPVWFRNVRIKALPRGGTTSVSSLDR